MATPIPAMPMTAAPALDHAHNIPKPTPIVAT
jgi:hypothetical protein